MIKTQNEMIQIWDDMIKSLQREKASHEEEINLDDYADKDYEEIKSLEEKVVKLKDVIKKMEDEQK